MEIHNEKPEIGSLSCLRRLRTGREPEGHSEKRDVIDTTDVQIKTAYGKLLKEQGIKYYGGKDFTVCIPLRSIEKSYTRVSDCMDGKMLLTDYCASCIGSFRTAEKVARAIQAGHPGYRVDAEHYSSGYEIAVYKYIPFTTIENLHQEVLNMAAVVDDGCRIAREILGPLFDR